MPHEDLPELDARGENMFKIGDFSKLSQLTVKTLRYYDEIGLLKPVQVDRFTGYRYYSADQLPRLNRLLALRDLDLSLEQISELLDGDLTTEQIREMLRAKQEELHQRVDEERMRLARVEARLRQIEREGTMPDYEIVIKRVDPIRVAALRDVIPTYSHVGQLFDGVMSRLGRHGIRPIGPGISLYYDHEYKERDVDLEAALPVGAPVTSGDGLEVRELPGIETAACLIHRGSYETLPEAYGALFTWFGTHGYRIAGPNREVYLRCPGEEGKDSPAVTEIQVPVEKE